MNKAFENNSVISHYRIVSKIGKGGMGEVYLAQDTKLDRKVALKILPAEFAEDKDRMSRFVREAKSASALNHPNIITIHEIGDFNGTNFIATEFIDGRTLSEYSKANPLNYSSALDIAIQVASALDEAHHAGIVHRDIKPDNIMVRSNGLVKVLDFGIAKVSDSAASAGGLNLSSVQHSADASTVSDGSEMATATTFQSATAPGIIIGTPRYMSPEQARGKGVDHRTDIFSFGVVFYEMLTGSSPFAGDTVGDVIAAVLMKEPEGLSGIPPEVKEIVVKALQKDKQKRYQSAKDLLHDLKEVKQEIEIKRRLMRASSPNLKDPDTHKLKTVTDEENPPAITHASHNSIAVLPFTNISADEDNEYFCDGLAEELLNALSKIEDLKVSARSSAFSFKGKNTDVSEIGEKLSVKNVLEGSVRKSGDKLRISVQLVNSAEGYQIWSERYDREMKDIFDVQDEIALAVVDALKLKLFGDEKSAVLKRGTQYSAAYELYLKGRYHFAKREKPDLELGVDYFQKAIKLDPNFSLAYVGIADSYNTMPGFAFLSPHKATPLARSAAQRAIEIDPQLAEAHTALADCFATYDYNWEAAEREYKRAIELNPNAAISHFHFALFYLIPMGRMEEATREMSRALELEPFNLIFNANIVGTYLFAGRDDKALEQALRVYELEPNFIAGQFWLGMAYACNGKHYQAIAHTEDVRRNDPDNQLLMMLAGVVYANAGRKTEAKRIVARFRELAKTQYVVSYYLAIVYAILDKKEETFAELEKGFEQRDFHFSGLSTNFVLAPLRNDPRFQALLKRMGLKE